MPIYSLVVISVTLIFIIYFLRFSGKNIQNQYQYRMWMGSSVHGIFCITSYFDATAVYIYIINCIYNKYAWASVFCVRVRDDNKIMYYVDADNGDLQHLPK